jgi:hypothetical protein
VHPGVVKINLFHKEARKQILNSERELVYIPVFLGVIEAFCLEASLVFNQV